MAIKVKKLHPDAVIPQYQSKGASGFDFHSLIDTHIDPKSTAIIPTGLCFDLPESFEIQIRSRSSLAAKSSVFVTNSPGTVDSDYRGEVKIILHNLSEYPFFIKKGHRIAQGVIQVVNQFAFEEVEELSTTERGEKGFGSTGK